MISRQSKGSALGIRVIHQSGGTYRESMPEVPSINFMISTFLSVLYYLSCFENCLLFPEYIYRRSDPKPGIQGPSQSNSRI